MIRYLTDAQTHLGLLADQTKLLELIQDVLDNDCQQSEQWLKAQLIVENFLSVAKMHHEEIGACLRRIQQLHS